MKKITLSYNELLAFFTQNIHLLTEGDVYVDKIKAHTPSVSCHDKHTFEKICEPVEFLESITLTLEEYED